jgi:hypothetical protein
MDGRRAIVHQRQASLLLDGLPNPRTASMLNMGIAIHSQCRLAPDNRDKVASAIAVAEQHHDVDMWCQAAAINAYALWTKGLLREAFEMIAVARGRATANGGATASFAVSMAEGFMSLLLWDPRAAQTAFAMGLGDMPPDKDSSLREILCSHLGYAKLFAGDLRAAEELAITSRNDLFKAQLALYKGNWTDARSLLLMERDRAHALGNHRLEWGVMFWLARLYRAELNLANAEDVLRSSLTIGEERIPAHEICSRTELALLLVQLDRVDEARSEVARCEELAIATEEWRGLRGLILRAQAVLMAATLHWAEANVHFEKAREVFQKYALPWEEAENTLAWGVFLLVTQDNESAEAKWAVADSLYRSHEYGQKWLDRIRELRVLATLTEQVHKGAAADAITQSLLKEHRSGDHESLRPLNLRAAYQGHGPKAIYDLVTTTDLALIATLTYDAIAHIISCADRIGRLVGPIERMANSMEAGVEAMNTKTPEKRRNKLI